MKPFTLGAIAGMSSLALAIPILAQVAGAASSDSSSAMSARFQHEAPSQECVEALVAMNDAVLDSFDAMTAAHKNALIAKRDALEAAAQIADETERQEALHKAEEDFRAAMEAARDANDMDAIMEAVRSACGGMFGGHGPMMMGMEGGHGMKGPRGPMMDRLAEKLGLTEEELQAELDAGKTIPEIAEEQGVELPEKPGRGHGKMFGRFAGPASENGDQ